MDRLCRWLSMDRADILIIGAGFAAIFVFGFVCGYVVRWLT